ncbi:MAG TPA: hypothetical protein VLL05_17825 [Terriglobales bacterium]|nr:hypothetical protein [Terriglobales bacterium]
MNVVLGFLRKPARNIESEQAILRIVIGGLVLAYVWIVEHPRADLMLWLAAYFALAILLLAAICIWPAGKVLRRSMVIIGMVADVAIITWVMFFVGPDGVGLFGVYLFITFGNLFRYGRAYMFACQSLCIVGFMVVLLFAPWWSMNQAVGVGLLIQLIMLPTYVSTLLLRIQQRLQQQNAPISG